MALSRLPPLSYARALAAAAILFSIEFFRLSGRRHGSLKNDQVTDDGWPSFLSPACLDFAYAAT